MPLGRRSRTNACRVIVFVTLACAACAQTKQSGNLNGLYDIANPSGVGSYSTDYSTKPGTQFFDLYSPLITTVYAEVYWTMQDAVPLPPDVVARFANKTMAIVGYEVDQVSNATGQEVSVPLYHSYNHHYIAYMYSADTTLVEVPADERGVRYGFNHGSMTYWKFSNGGGYGVGDVPNGIMFSEGNGGEFRMSYHGYPAGYAQLIKSPANFQVQPMQIDTRNRDYNGPGFKAGLLPRSSTAPPNATYSGLLECPCTTRIVKKWSTVYDTISSGTCSTPVANATECFDAAATVGKAPSWNVTVADKTLPSGCFVVNHANGTVTAVFNKIETPVGCGGARVYSGATTNEIGLGLLLDASSDEGVATITLTGPDGVWFGVGFNATVMEDYPYAIVVDGFGNVTEHKLGNHDGGSLLSPTQVRVVSNEVFKGSRTVVLTRAFAGLTADYYTFSIEETLIPFINAIGASPNFSYHKARNASTISLTAVDASTCVCNDGIKGTINGLAFSKNCAPEPLGDMLAQHNPTCFVQTYQGGLDCCHHQQVLLDADQPVDNRTDTVRLKFRIWYQEYTDQPQPSHQNLLRLFIMTEAYAGEYDVLQAPPGTPADQAVSMIEGHQQAHQLPWWGQPVGPGYGVEIIYAGGHCHAPSCLSLELYNADTGELLCRQAPLFGNGTEPFNEDGYISGIPPCLWGREPGLLPPVFLSWDTNLTSIKRNNNTYAHYGEMAFWQMQGVIVPQP